MRNAVLLGFYTALLDPHQEGVFVDVDRLAVELAARQFLPLLSHDAHVVVLLTNLEIDFPTCLVCGVYRHFARISFRYMLLSVTTGSLILFIRRWKKTTVSTL